MRGFGAVLAVFALMVSTVSFADDDNLRFPMDLHDLRLNSKQHHEVEAAMKEYQKEYRRFHRQNEKTEQDIRTLFLNPVFDERTFQAKHMEMARVSADIRTRLFARLHSILTPEQKRRFIRHMEEWEIE